MNPSELIAMVADYAREPNLLTGDILKTAAMVVTMALRAGGEVSLPGLGKLYVKERASRTGRNPKTGETLTIPARRVVLFGPSKALRDAVSK